MSLAVTELRLERDLAVLLNEGEGEDELVVGEVAGEDSSSWTLLSSLEAVLAALSSVGGTWFCWTS